MDGERPGVHLHPIRPGWQTGVQSNQSAETILRMKPLTRTFCAMLLAGGVGGVFFERNALSNARIENQRLRAESEETVRLLRENAEVDRLRAENQEQEQLRHETRDLHKLRNEVRQLREQKSEWDKLDAQNQKLRMGADSAGPPASRAAGATSLIPNELLSDAGFASPEATLRTFFWAMREGNVERARSCFTADTPGELIPGGGTPIGLAGFRELRVVAKKVVSTDEVKLGIQLSADQDATPDEWVLPFRRVEGEWKINLAPAR